LPEVPESLLEEARVERALWAEYHHNSVSLNAVLADALRLHTGMALELFMVSLLVCLRFRLFRAFGSDVSSSFAFPFLPHRGWKARQANGFPASPT
jgi:hypothetical protein